MRKSSRAVVATAALWAMAFSVSWPVSVGAQEDGAWNAAGASLSKPPPRINDVVQIARVRGTWMEAINTLDVDRLLGLYAPGAVLFPEGGPARLGVGAIGSWHGRWSARADVHYTIEGAALRFDGNRAVEEWTAVVTITPRDAGEMAISGDPLQFRQHGVRVYRKDEWGQWRIDRETWSPDHPAAARFVALESPTCTVTLC